MTHQARDYTILTWWDTVNEEYIAQCVELIGVMCKGDTRAAAADAAEQRIKKGLALAAEEGRQLKPPVTAEILELVNAYLFHKLREDVAAVIARRQ